MAKGKKAAAKPEPTGQVRADHLTRFGPGNPGRPKGSRNKLSEDFVKALSEDFHEHGKAAIQTMRAEDPSGYVKTIASLLPKDVNVNVGNLEGLSDDELLQRIHDLESEFAALVAGESGASRNDASPEAVGEIRDIRPH